MTKSPRRHATITVTLDTLERLRRLHQHIVEHGVGDLPAEIQPYEVSRVTMSTTIDVAVAAAERAIGVRGG